MGGKGLRVGCAGGQQHPWLHWLLLLALRLLLLRPLLCLLLVPPPRLQLPQLRGSWQAGLAAGGPRLRWQQHLHAAAGLSGGL